jgi:hypothetical protein
MPNSSTKFWISAPEKMLPSHLHIYQSMLLCFQHGGNTKKNEDDKGLALALDFEQA